MTHLSSYGHVPVIMRGLCFGSWWMPGTTHSAKDLTIGEEKACSTADASGAPPGERLGKPSVTLHVTQDDPGIPEAPWRMRTTAQRISIGERNHACRDLSELVHRSTKNSSANFSWRPIFPSIPRPSTGQHSMRRVANVSTACPSGPKRWRLSVQPPALFNTGYHSRRIP